MKKLLGIIVLGLLVSTPAYSWCIFNCASKDDIKKLERKLKKLERNQQTNEDSISRKKDKKVDCSLSGDPYNSVCRYSLPD